MGLSLVYLSFWQVGVQGLCEQGLHLTSSDEAFSTTLSNHSVS